MASSPYSYLNGRDRAVDGVGGAAGGAGLGRPGGARLLAVRASRRLRRGRRRAAPAVVVIVVAHVVVIVVVRHLEELQRGLKGRQVHLESPMTSTSPLLHINFIGQCLS